MYNTYFRYKLTFRDGVVVLISPDLYKSDKLYRQTGGDPEFISITTSSGDYIFKDKCGVCKGVVYPLVGEVINVNGGKHEPRLRNYLKIFFLSLLDEQLELDDADNDNPVNCVTLTTDPDTRIGTINGLSSKYSCVGVPVSDDLPWQRYNGEDQGSILMKGLLNYCIANRERLGIDQLELNDIATRECKTIFGKFLISKSNMLQGRLPYYMKFGFTPSIPTAMIKIKNNLEIVKSLRLEDIETLITFFKRRECAHTRSKSSLFFKRSRR